MRLGFFLGFLIGAGVASVLSKVERGEAPAVENATRKVESETKAATDSVADSVSEATQSAVDTTKSAVDQLKGHAREALDAAKQASAEKEAEMMRAFEESTKPQDTKPKES